MTRVEQQVDGGIASVDAALGDPKAIAPFFRIPGLGRTDAVEGYLASKSLVVWSADVVADDWKHISAKEIVKRAMRRLNEKGRGILLLHDIHPATVLALPTLLKELKEQGYHIVQVVAAGEHPPTLCLNRLRHRTPARKHGRGSFNRNPRIRPSKRRYTIAPRSPRASTGGPPSSVFMSRTTAPIRKTGVRASSRRETDLLYEGSGS